MNISELLQIAIEARKASERALEDVKIANELIRGIGGDKRTL